MRRRTERAPKLLTRDGNGPGSPGKAQYRRLGQSVPDRNCCCSPQQIAADAKGGNVVRPFRLDDHPGSFGAGVFIIVPVIGMKKTPTSFFECTLPSASLV